MRRGRHTRRWHVAPWTLLLVAAMGALVFLAGSAVVTSFGQREAATRADSAEDTLRNYADAVAEACERDGETARKLGGLCDQPESPRIGVDGDDGVGIANVSPGDCSVAIRLTDQRLYTLRDLCGKDGAKGEPGRGIESTVADGCFVQVAFTDGTSERLGPFCGQDGADGKDGEDGKDGADGADGQTPPCMSEPNQCRGDPGKDGTDGEDGKDGEPGPTCPDGYELRDAVVTAPDGRTYEGKACVDPSTEQEPEPDPPLNGTR